MARELGMGELRFFSPHQLRRRRGLRDRPAGGDGGRDRHGRRRGCLPRLQRALGDALRPGLAGAAAQANTNGLDNAWTYPHGLSTPAATVAMQARRYMHEYGATTADFGRVAVADRRHAATNPAAWFYEQPITLDGPPGLAADRRAAAAARLLPGERRRGGDRRHHDRAGARPRGGRRADRGAAAQGSGADQYVMTRYYRDDIGIPEIGVVGRAAVAAVRARPGRHRRPRCSTTTSRRSC